MTKGMDNNLNGKGLVVQISESYSAPLQQTDKTHSLFKDTRNLIQGYNL